MFGRYSYLRVFSAWTGRGGRCEGGKGYEPRWTQPSSLKITEQRVSEDHC
jgi:hypothetical protein